MRVYIHKSQSSQKYIVYLHVSCHSSNGTLLVYLLWELHVVVTQPFDIQIYIYISTATYIHTSCKYFRYGGFLKQGYPQIIHFKKLFPYKPPILGYPHLWTPPNPFGTTPSYSPNAKAAGSANACVKRSRCHCRVEED